MTAWDDLDLNLSPREGRVFIACSFGLAAICFLVAFVLLWPSLRSGPPLTADEVSGFAAQLETSLAAGDAGVYVDRAPGWAEEGGQALGRALLADLARRDARWTFLRVLPGQPVRLVFRDLGARSLDYHFVALRRADDGKVGWANRYSVLRGESLRQAVWRARVAEEPGLTDDEAVRRRAADHARLQALLDDGQDRKVLEAFYKVPRSLRTRALELIRLQAAARIGETAYASALEDLEAADDDYELALLDHLLAAGRFDRALEALDRIQATVGGDDAHLLALRARIRLGQGDVPRASSAARRALEQEPNLLSALFTALDVALEQQDHPWTAELLTALQDAGEDLRPDVTEAQAFAPFRASPTGQAWLNRER